MTKPKTPKLEHVGSLITIEGIGTCLGHLMHFEGHGVYEPTYGKVEVSPENVETHNDLLDAALIEGLDRCEVGQCGSFYLYGDSQITTFTGLVVSDNVTVNGRSVTFRRKEKTFRGRKSVHHDLLNFRRIS